MAQRTSVIPESAGQVAGKLLKFKPSSVTVDEARAAMMAAKESAVTTRNGVAVPTFIREASERGQGGNIPSGRPTNSAQAFLDSAKAKVAALKVPQGRRVNLNAMVEHGYLLQAEADALLAESSGAQAPEPPKVEDVLEPEPTLEVIPVTENEPAPEPAPVRVAADEIKPEIRSVETNEFVGRIFREGKDWVAEITYKNGAGQERFTANSKDELMVKLLEGKGHGTVKVREVVKENKRRLLYGEENDNWDFFFNEVKNSHGLTVEQYRELPEQSQALIQDTIQAEQIIRFQQNWPEYYYTQKNFQKVGKYLNAKKPESWPLTYRNMEIAYRDLSEQNELEVRPTPRVDVAPQAAPEVQAQPVASKTEDSASAPAALVAAAAPVVRKRASTGLIPGSSSASSSDGSGKAEDGTKQREPSVTELRALSDADLKRIATKDRKFGVRY